MWFLLCAVQSRHHGFFDLRFVSKNLVSQVYSHRFLCLYIHNGWSFWYSWDLHKKSRALGTSLLCVLFLTSRKLPFTKNTGSLRVSPRRFHWISHWIMMMGWTDRLWQGYGLFVFASWQMEGRCFMPSSSPTGIETDCARMHMSRQKGLFGYGHCGFQWGKHLINLIWRHQPLSKRMEWI